MNVKIVHLSKNEWQVHPIDNDDYYLVSYTLFIDAKMYINSNFHTLIKKECIVSDCRECK